MNKESILFLDTATEIYTKIKSVSSTLKKQEILKKIYDNNPKLVKKILLYVYDTNIQFNVKPANVQKFTKNKKYDETEYLNTKSITELLDALSARKITGHIALKSVNEFIKKEPKYKNIINMILKKNIEIRLNKKSINNIVEIIPDFQVVLANDFNKKQKHFEKYSKDDWYITRKYDGVRIIADMNIKDESIRYFSRLGKELDTLDFLTKSLDWEKLKKKTDTERIILDGEVIYNDNDSEDFKKIMEVIKNPERDQSKLAYIIFDLLDPEDFYKGKSDIILSERLEDLKFLFGRKNGKFIPIKYYLFTDKNFEKMQDKVSEKNWEGLMLRRDTIYEGKRTNDLLKVKKFEDAEFKVIDIIPTEIRDGNNNKRTVLGAIVLDFNDVKVGSGFSEKERIYYYEHPEEIIGKIVTVQYFEKTPDNKLRFPTLKYIHGVERMY